MNTSEALAPVNDFARTILLATAVIALLVSAASILIARVFTAPLQRLLTGVRAVAGGELGTRVDAGSNDEFGDLGVGVQRHERRTGVTPGGARCPEGRERTTAAIADARAGRPALPRWRDRHLRGAPQRLGGVHRHRRFRRACGPHLPSGEALALLNSLSRGFDEAAAKVGIEKVRSSGTSFVASSGLVVQRVDHVRRVVDFAIEVAAMVDRFNAQNNASLLLRAGVDTGEVRSGLVGGGDVVYNLWGDAVSLAHRIRTAAGDAGIYVTDDVKERLAGAYAFEQAGTVVVDGVEKSVWQPAA